MTEAGFTNSVRMKLIPHVYPLKLNLRFMKGVSDCWYSGSKSDLWNEHKYLQSIPPELDLCGGKDPILSIHQQDWLRSRYAEGRNVAVIVGSKKGALFLPDLEWEGRVNRDEFIERAMSTGDLAEFLIDRLGDRVSSIGRLN